MTVGRKYCYSFWVKSPTETTVAFNNIGWFQVCDPYGKNDYSFTENGSVEYIGAEVPANEWTRVYTVFTPNDLNCTFNAFFHPFTPEYIDIHGIQLEAGEEPTDWSLAPEEIAHSISAISQTADEISMAVSEIETGKRTAGAVDAVDNVTGGSAVVINKDEVIIDTPTVDIK